MHLFQCIRWGSSAGKTRVCLAKGMLGLLHKNARRACLLASAGPGRRVGPAQHAFPYHACCSAGRGSRRQPKRRAPSISCWSSACSPCSRCSPCSPCSQAPRLHLLPPLPLLLPLPLALAQQQPEQAPRGEAASSPLQGLPSLSHTAACTAPARFCTAPWRPAPNTASQPASQPSQLAQARE